MSLKVEIITTPVPYCIDFSQFLPSEPKEQALRVHEIGISIIKCVRVVLWSAWEAGRLTLTRSVRALPYTVLDLFRMPLPFLPFFKISYWSIRAGCEFLATTIRLARNELISSSDKLGLVEFVHDGIDTRHLRTNARSLDTSKVPDEIQVRQLAELLDNVNFEDESAPGYMPASSRTEDKKVYTKAELQRQVNKLINHVENRTPYIGTPPAHDRVRLHAFYQQIEDALRLSLHAVIEEMDAFLEGNGSDVAAYDQEQMRQYKNLLENQSRLAIDMAIAGAHCGARYMGDAWTSYFSFCGEQTVAGETLEDRLIELLAARRQKIAVSQAQRLYGTSTHGFSQYIDRIGKLVGIPGAENTIEYMGSRKFDRDKCLRLFFDTYTEDLIVDTVQEEVKKSQKFREFILDWLQGQDLENWKPMQDPRLTVERLEEIKSKAVSINELLWGVTVFQTMLTHRSGEEKTSWVKGLQKIADSKSWADFVEEVFSLRRSRRVFEQACKENKGEAHTTPMDIASEKQRIKQLLTHGSIAKLLEERYRSIGRIEVDDMLRDLLQKMAKVDEMRSVLPVDERVLLRVLSGDTDVRVAIEGHLVQQRGGEFLHALELRRMKEDGLPLVLLEWLLDAHQILRPKCLNIEAFPEQREWKKVPDLTGYARTVTYYLGLSGIADLRSSRVRIPIRSTVESAEEKEAIRWRVFEAAFRKGRKEIEEYAHNVADMSMYTLRKERWYARGLLFVSEALDICLPPLRLFSLVACFALLVKTVVEHSTVDMILAYHAAAISCVGLLSFLCLGLSAILSHFEHRMAQSVANKMRSIANYVLGQDRVFEALLSYFAWLTAPSRELGVLFKNKAADLEARQVVLSKKGCYALFKRALQHIGDQPRDGYMLPCDVTMIEHLV